MNDQYQLKSVNRLSSGINISHQRPHKIRAKVMMAIKKIAADVYAALVVGPILPKSSLIPPGSDSSIMHIGVLNKAAERCW